MRLALDHLVIAARTLAEGLAWCDAVFGVRPDAGGRHAFMGTHNRVFGIGLPGFPQAYAEIIAIDPDAAAPTRHARWFDLDDAALQLSLAAEGPQLVHWVARCDDIVVAHAAMRTAGVDAGDLRAAERMTPRGLLRWRIGVRPDGSRPLAGAAPALIAWDGTHPTDSLPDSGVQLQALRLGGVPEALRPALPAGVECDDRQDAPPLVARLTGRRGPVTLTSPPPKRRGASAAQAPGP